MSQGHRQSTVASVRAWVLGFVVLVATLLAGTLASAASVSLAWDAASGTSPAGYTIHSGTASGSYTAQVDVGATTTGTVSGLAEGATYYFAVTAYDTSGGRSGYSNEVSRTVPYAAPAASFTVSATAGVAPLSVNFTSTSTGTITAYAWTFGDGTTSTAQNPAKTYSAAGVYTVALTVTGPGGSNTRTSVNYIAVSASADTTPPGPPASLSASANGSAGINLSWPAATDNVGVTGYRVERCQGPSCTNFAQIATPTATSYGDSGLAAGSTYRYRVRATDAAGNLGPYSPTASATTVASAPVASFTGTPISGTAPLTVNFTSTSTGSITTYAWTFGDGTTSATQNPSKVYQSAGSYTVGLTVTGPGGSHTSTRTNYVTVSAPAAALQNVGVFVDQEPAAGTGSNLNGILEPGETVLVAPIWQLTAGGPVSVTASAQVSGQGSSAFRLNDSAAAYGSLSLGATVDCESATGNCYLLSVSSNVRRPTLKWGITFTETLSTGTTVSRTIPIGRSFLDVATTDMFYPQIEALVWNDVTYGYADGTYQPGLAVTRWQTAMFLARAASRGSGPIPTSGMVGTRSYNCSTGGISLFSDVPPADAGCPQIHYLASRAVNLSFECGGSTRACPSNPTTRAAMAVVVAGAIATGGDAGVPSVGTFNDTGNARSYNCATTGGSHFRDVSSSSNYCRHVNYLWARGIVDGYADGTYHPELNLTRGQMAKFVTNAFGLRVQ